MGFVGPNSELKLAIHVLLQGFNFVKIRGSHLNYLRDLKVNPLPIAFFLVYNRENIRWVKSFGAHGGFRGPKFGT